MNSRKAVFNASPKEISPCAIVVRIVTVLSNSMALNS